MANPLDLMGARGGGGGERYDPEGLNAYCYTMNAMNFVIANGWEYFVNVRTLPSGKPQHYVDRRDHQRSMPPRLVQQAKAALTPPRETRQPYAD